MSGADPGRELYELHEPHELYELTETKNPKNEDLTPDVYGLQLSGKTVISFQFAFPCLTN